MPENEGAAAVADEETQDISIVSTTDTPEQIADALRGATGATDDAAAEADAAAAAAKPASEQAAPETGAVETQDGDDDEEIEETPETPAPKKPSSYQRRLDTLFGELKTAQHDLGARDQRVKDLEAEIAALKADPTKAGSKPGDGKPATASADDDDPEPVWDEEKFDDWAAFVRAQSAWTRRQTTREVERQVAAVKAELTQGLTAQQAEERARQQALIAHTDRLDAARKKYADFDDVLKKADGVQVSPILQHVMVTDALGADIAYFCAQPANGAQVKTWTDEFNRLAAIRTDENRPTAEREQAERAVYTLIGKVQARVEAVPSGPATREVPVTGAPDPVKPAGSAPVASTKKPDDMSHEEYRKWRQANSRSR
jgi:hypothetical protein